MHPFAKNVRISSIQGIVKISFCIALLVLAVSLSGAGVALASGETLSADFSSDVRSGYAPLNVTFTGVSENATEWQWDVDEGTSIYTSQSFTHAYHSAGVYNVTLTVSNLNETTTVTKESYIEVIAVPVLPVAGFSGTPTSGTVPLTVVFTDLSSNATSWEWNFGDSSANSTIQNPTHTYTTVGTYTVTLTAGNGNGTSTEVKTNYIVVDAVPVLPVAGFSGTPTSGTVPLTVVFTDLSSNATSWEWNFGDSSANSTIKDPTHTYTTVGTYTVTLTAGNGNGTSTEVKSNYIVVDAVPVLPVAGFSGTPTSGTVPLTVSFTDLSSSATSWEWNFGDGSTNSTIQNPIHTYTTVGTYTVTLTIENGNGTSTEVKSNYIVVDVVPVLPTAGFVANVTEGTVPLTVVFTDLSSSATSWDWDFGDGSANSTIKDPTHTYTTVGTYTVTLTVENGNGTSTEVKSNYIVVDAVPVLPVAGFSGTPTSGTVPLTVVFTDLSSSATSWEWNFGDGSTNSTIQNPTHTYTSVGTYTVTLTVENGNGTLSTSRAGYITVTAVTPTTGGGGSGGGGQSTGEKYENIELKDYSIKYVLRDTETMFEFTKEGNSIVGIGFTARLNGGQTKTVIEMLKSTSTMVNKAAPGTVYKNVNIWVGDGKTAPDLLSDARIMFKVEKAWIAGNGIDPASIRMLRYNSGSWAQLPTSRISEDETYVYYITQTPGFSAFAISSIGKEEQQVIPGSNQQGSPSQGGESAQMSTEDSQPPQAGNAVSPEAKSSGSFTFLLILAGISALGALCYRYKDQLSQVRTQLGNPDGKRYRRFKRS